MATNTGKRQISESFCPCHKAIYSMKTLSEHFCLEKEVIPTDSKQHLKQAVLFCGTFKLVLV
jgi:hypothetical protein